MVISQPTEDTILLKIGSIHFSMVYNFIEHVIPREDMLGEKEKYLVYLRENLTLDMWYLIKINGY